MELKMELEEKAIYEIYKNGDYYPFLERAKCLLQRGYKSEFLYTSLSNIYFLFDNPYNTLYYNYLCHINYPRLLHYENQLLILREYEYNEQLVTVLLYLYKTTKEYKYYEEMISLRKKISFELRVVVLEELFNFYNDKLIDTTTYMVSSLEVIMSHEKFLLQYGKKELEKILTVLVIDSHTVLHKMETYNKVEQIICMIYLLLPNYYYVNSREISDEYNKLEYNLIELNKKKLYTFTISEYIRYIPINFIHYYSYLGIPIANLMSSYSYLVRKLIPDLALLTLTKSKSKKIGVCFSDASNEFEHYMSRIPFGIISSLYENVDVYVIQYQSNGCKTNMYESLKNIIIVNDIESCISLIQKEQFDGLLFTEINQCSVMYVLSHIRFAPKQYSYSMDTVGVNTIDFHISSKLIDSPESYSYFTERLLSNKGLPCYYYNFDLFPFCNESKQSIRDLYKWSNQYHYYGISNTYLYNPLFMRMLKSILKNDELAMIVIYSINEKEKELLRSYLYPYDIRLVFIQEHNTHSYARMIQSVDIILDTYPFTEECKSLDAFYFNKIVITMSFTKKNGRYTYGFYKKIKVKEPVCFSEDEFIKKSIFYATNEKEREVIEKNIKDNSPLLFNNIFTKKELNELF